MEHRGSNRPRVQAPTGRYIPAQGGGGWRAFFARRVAAALGYEPNETKALKGRDIVLPLPSIGRPFRARQIAEGHSLLRLNI